MTSTPRIESDADGFFFRIGDVRHGHWRSHAEARAGLAVEQRRAASRTTPSLTAVRPAGPDHQVLTIQGGPDLYRRRPCATCPWRVDATGKFPASAFRHSADTAYDMASHQFGCHESGAHRIAACAGFLLRGAEHNFSVRVGKALGKFNPSKVTDGGVALHASYRAMAVANGVDPADPVLVWCRP